jgi:hypothetical protein
MVVAVAQQNPADVKPPDAKPAQATAPQAKPADTKSPEPDYASLISAALPKQAYARPASPRKLLIFTLTRGFRHSSIPVGVQALTQLGQQVGAYEAVASEDIAQFEPEALRGFDAVCFLSTTGELFTPPDADKLPSEARAAADERAARLRKSFLSFVESGKGFVGIHAATDTFYQWPGYGQLIGGYFDGHPWHESVVIKLDDPAHPLNVMFDGRPLVIVDEIYEHRDPYSRQRQRVLLSLDTDRTDMKKEGIKRQDGDFGVTWIRTQGVGRVFYCSLGHREDVFCNPSVLRHYLAGIQYALGDLPADATPVPLKPAQQPVAP